MSVGPSQEKCLNCNSKFDTRSPLCLLTSSPPPKKNRVCAFQNCRSLCKLLCWNLTLNGIGSVSTYSRLWLWYPGIRTSQYCTDVRIVVTNIGTGYTSKIQDTSTITWAVSCLSRAHPVSPSQCPWINIPNNSSRRIKHTALQAGRSRVPFPMVSLEFLIDTVLPAALWP